jgi:hypothetical protein
MASISKSKERPKKKAIFDKIKLQHSEGEEEPPIK